MNIGLYMNIARAFHEEPVENLPEIERRRIVGEYLRISPKIPLEDAFSSLVNIIKGFKIEDEKKDQTLEYLINLYKTNNTSNA